MHIAYSLTNDGAQRCTGSHGFTHTASAKAVAPYHLIISKLPLYHTSVGQDIPTTAMLEVQLPLATVLSTTA